jgi:hypothetical protein
MRRDHLGLSGVRPDAPKGAGGTVTEDGLFATCEYCSEPPAFPRDARVPNRVHAAMDHVQPAREHARIDHPRRQAKGEQLEAGDDPVLPSSECSVTASMEA